MINERRVEFFNRNMSFWIASMSEIILFVVENSREFQPKSDRVRETCAWKFDSNAVNKGISCWKADCMDWSIDMEERLRVDNLICTLASWLKGEGLSSSNNQTHRDLCGCQEQKNEEWNWLVEIGQSDIEMERFQSLSRVRKQTKGSVARERYPLRELLDEANKTINCELTSVRNCVGEWECEKQYLMWNIYYRSWNYWEIANVNLNNHTF